LVGALAPGVPKSQKGNGSSVGGLKPYPLSNGENLVALHPTYLGITEVKL